MGRQSLESMLEVSEFWTTLRWHLAVNHYPAIPETMLEACAEAIANANAGDWEAEVVLPDGVSWRGFTTCPTYALIEHAHLDGFLTGDDGEG